MAVEIERKFLVKNDLWKPYVEASGRIVQGYLVSGAQATVRIRVKGDSAWLTIKGATSGISRSEYEYAIPVEDALAMLRDLLASPAIEKTRYLVRSGAHLWELDVFAGGNEGLVMAEVELACEDEPFDTPAWAGEEVTGDPRYYNSHLARNPFRNW